MSLNIALGVLKEIELDRVQGIDRGNKSCPYLLGERLAADLAGERFESGVNELVSFKVSLLSERFQTSRTLKRAFIKTFAARTARTGRGGAVSILT